MKVLLTDDTHHVLAKRLVDAGLQVSLRLDLDYDGILAIAPQYDAIVVRSKIVIDKHFIDACPSLRCIGRVGAGMETIDVDYAESRGIRCLNSPEGNCDAVGDHAVGLLLSLLNNISRADNEVRHGLWHREANRGRELGGLTVGIVGFGNMGSAFAKRLRGFDCPILAYDKYKRHYAPDYVQEVSLEELFHHADVVSLHVPLTDETRYMVSWQFLDSFAKSIFLVNTSRGAVVNTADLVDAMKKGKVLGSALDVLEYENMANDGVDVASLPEPFRFLIQSPNVVLTPHVAGWTVESKYKLAAVLADKIIDVFK